MKMLYAWQVAPEDQESRLCWSSVAEEYPEVAVFGNRSFGECVFSAYARVKKALEEAKEEYTALKADLESANYDSLEKLVNDMLYKDAGVYSAEEVLVWETILDAEEPDEVDALGLVMGEPYKQVTIRGCCQGDWQHLYCPASWTREQVHAFEAEYFNTGTEWLVAEEASEDDDEPTSPQDVDTCSYYDSLNDEEAFRAMLAQEYGLDVSQVVLYAHDGYQRIARYKRV